MSVTESISSAALPLTLVAGMRLVPVLLEHNDAQVAAFVRAAPDKDDNGEDAICILEHGDGTLIVAVADGAGGYNDGAIASALAIAALIADCIAGGELPARAAILNGFEAAHRAIKDQGGGGATTLAVVELTEGNLRTYHAGDSGVLVCGQRGRVKLRSVVHSPTGYAVEAGMLDDSEALHHEERHMVSNLLGREPMSVEIGSPVVLAQHDTVVIASDGLFDNLYVEEIVAIVRKGPLGEACRVLAETALRRMLDAPSGAPSKPDDLSIVLLRRARPR